MSCYYIFGIDIDISDFSLTSDNISSYTCVLRYYDFLLSASERMFYYV